MPFPARARNLEVVCGCSTGAEVEGVGSTGSGSPEAVDSGLRCFLALICFGGTGRAADSIPPGAVEG